MNFLSISNQLNPVVLAGYQVTVSRCVGGVLSIIKPPPTPVALICSNCYSFILSQDLTSLHHEVCSDTPGDDSWLRDAAGEHVDHQEAEHLPDGGVGQD